jgi:hypothetical protein
MSLCGIHRFVLLDCPKAPELKQSFISDTSESANRVGVESRGHQQLALMRARDILKICCFLSLKHRVDGINSESFAVSD